MVIGTSLRVGQLDIAPETTPYALFVKNASIRRVKQVKYLGLIIDENLTWDHHINYISQIKAMLGMLCWGEIIGILQLVALKAFSSVVDL